MIYSLSEIEAQARKAVRGAGFAWGYAEEAGKAVRWLATYQLPSVELLAAYLKRRQPVPEQYQAPVLESQNWKPLDNGTLCPLLTGACLCDLRAQVLEAPLVLQQMAAPLLLLPYFAFLAGALNTTGEIHWPGVRLHCQGNYLQHVEDDQLGVSIASSVYCHLLAQNNPAHKPYCTGQVVEDKIWQILDEFAYRTYVPASEVSRRGAGPTD